MENVKNTVKIEIIRKDDNKKSTKQQSKLNLKGLTLSPFHDKRSDVNEIES